MTDQFKKGVEDILNRLQDAIRISLRTTIKSDMQQIDNFITIGNQKLNTKPTSVEEIGKAKAEAMEIANKKNTYLNLYNQCEERNKLLRMIAGEGANINDFRARWVNFESSLNAFSDMIDEQRKVLK